MSLRREWRRGPYAGGNKMLIVQRRRVAAYDADAAAWIALIEAADGAALEAAVKDVYNSFVIDCKADPSLNAGISNWAATEQLLILRGPRTLPGALITPKGPAVTSMGFGTGDYSRKIDLKGGETKYLNLNRGGVNDSQNNASGWVWVNRAATSNNTKYFGAQNDALSVQTYIGDFSGSVSLRINSAGSGIVASGAQRTGFMGITRNSATQQTARFSGGNTISGNSSVPPPAQNYFLFARNQNGNPNGHTDAGISAYGSGKAVDLALMDARVETLLADLAAAIP
jgi:hypothetical protein